MARRILGLVGGIACGKSTVASLFSRERRCRVVDADALARRIFGRGGVAPRIAERFPAARARGGGVDRARLAAIVFADAGELRALEEILHPPIRREMERAIAAARERYVLVDAPLLFETGADALCDAIVYVACPARVRRARARRDRGWSAEEHRARESRQWSCRRKRARADYVVDNGGDAEEARRSVRRLVRALERDGT